MPPQFGILTFPKGPFDDVADEWRRAEGLGFSHAWVADSLVGLRQVQDHESWTVLAALARSTQRIRIGTLISVMAFRHPTLLAAQALTVDRLSDGRLELGIGAGDDAADLAALGVPPPTDRERLERLEEQVTILDRLLRGERVDHHGTHYHASAAWLAPPAQRPRPPILVAAQGRRGIQLAARVADAWNTLGGQPTRPAEAITLEAAVDRTRAQVQLLDAACDEAQRDRSAVRRSVLAFRAPMDPLASLDGFDEFVGRYGELGFGEFVFYWPPISVLRAGERPSAAQRATLERIAAKRIARA